MTARLQAQALQLGYGESLIVDDLDLTVLDVTVTAVIGPNGCGMSTLLRALARLLKPRSGTVLLDGKQIDKLPTRDVAAVVGLLPRSPVAPEGQTVADLVARGRHPHQRWYRPDPAGVGPDHLGQAIVVHGDFRIGELCALLELCLDSASPWAAINDLSEQSLLPRLPSPHIASQNHLIESILQTGRALRPVRPEREVADAGSDRARTGGAVLSVCAG
jgi:ABC-type dipeptide/oligopeptide/nickel transport system ATPase component